MYYKHPNLLTFLIKNPGRQRVKVQFLAEGIYYETAASNHNNQIQNVGASASVRPMSRKKSVTQNVSRSGLTLLFDDSIKVIIFIYATLILFFNTSVNFSTISSTLPSITSVSLDFFGIEISSIEYPDSNVSPISS